jgi:phosphohistidine phosphatase
MKLLVIRHAPAGDRDRFAESGKPDDLRPVTAGGHKKMGLAARGLRALVPRIDLLVSSPLLRAQETAKIVAKAYGIDVGETTPALDPGSAMERFTEWAAPHADKDVVALVGHEPHLSTLVTWLLCGQEESKVQLRKGGACLIELEGAPRAGAAILLWLQPPKALRQLAR